MTTGTLLDDLYREILLDHYRQPRNHNSLDAPTCSADGSNPLCGDKVRIDVAIECDRIAAISFSGNGCSISQASASMMTEFVKGRTVAEARAGIDAFQQMMVTAEAPGLDGFDDIEALIGVAKFPARVKCASLAWKTLEQALAGEDSGIEHGAVTTDERSAEHD
ncbi:MAG: SUF system NifU family Fe-S cluster assembly protein [Chloroflexi bacterium]|nr:MAG: SUF system NifU family Fe-S cluster assembly protein [Chloroflexota bacterium]